MRGSGYGEAFDTPLFVLSIGHKGIGGRGRRFLCSALSSLLHARSLLLVGKHVREYVYAAETVPQSLNSTTSPNELAPMITFDERTKERDSRSELARTLQIVSCLELQSADKRTPYAVRCTNLRAGNYHHIRRKHCSFASFDDASEANGTIRNLENSCDLSCW